MTVVPSPTSPFIIAARMNEMFWEAVRINTFYNGVYYLAARNAWNSVDPQTSFYESWLSETDQELEKGLRTDEFIEQLSKLFNSGIELRSLFRKAGYPVKFLDWMFDSLIRNYMSFASSHSENNTTEFDVIFTQGNSRLLHYRNSRTPKKPLLIVYAPINRFHIMDLSPERSVVRDLLSYDIDVYILDWGSPSWSDDLSLEDYVSTLRRSVKVIRTRTGLKTVSLLGYCWGGIIALVYGALDSKDIDKIALMAAPIDSSKDSTILATWAKQLDVDKLMDEFGHMDAIMLDLGFLMRNPPRYAFDKYVKFFEKSGDAKFAETFIAVEKWLHNTPIIPGNLYRKIIKDCYKNNLLIANSMWVSGEKVNLANISAPLLTIVAENDDLVSPESTLAINDQISSKDKKVLQIPGGHVGLCAGKKAHETLWPEVSKWILKE